jgi:hypothetical protein
MEMDRPNVNTPENGLKILARMIAEAYQKELNEKRAKSKGTNEKKGVKECQSKD